MIKKNARDPVLDLLRALAILLVLGRHQTNIEWWHKVGWCGVDLFFVLSGYLVTGLLLDEFRQNGASRPIRFLLRRGFKIYPSYYLFLVVTVVLALSSELPRHWSGLFSEIVFLQNYLPGFMFDHLWSLAVEEHFYFGLAFGLFFLLTADRVRAWPDIVLGTMIVVFLLRTLLVLSVERDYKLLYYGTHARVDSLCFGSLICWWTRYRGYRLKKITVKYKWLILTGIFLSALFVFCSEFSDLRTKTMGFSLVYFGWGGVLLLALLCSKNMSWLKSRPIGILSAIGKNSYATYLWHPVVAIFLVPAILPHTGAAADPLKYTVLYLALSFFVGCLFSRVWETPFLRLRDKWIP